MAIIQDITALPCATYTAPDFRAGEDVFMKRSVPTILEQKLKENIKANGKRFIREKPAILSVTAAAACEDGHVSVLQKKRLLSVQVWWGSKSRPLTKEAIQKANGKLGDTDFHGRLLRLRQMKHHFAQLVC